MNFFKSILLDDPDPPKSEYSDEPGPDSSLNPPHQDGNPDGAAQDGIADGWSFGGLIKTLATRSESVIETYRKDLEEFGSGLKKETEIIREAASRAVKDLPASLEAGTSAAQVVLDGVLKSTADIISKEAQVFGSDGEPETPEMNRSLNSGRYSWFDAQLSAVQSDPNTFCEEPEDVEEYKKWKLGFDLDEKRDEMEDVIGENGTLEDVYKRVVPSVVDHDTFWCRYFYRVDKLKQQESVRANLVKRAISVDDDDDLSWDVDDDEEEKNGNKPMSVSNGRLSSVEIGERSSDGSKDEKKGGNLDEGDGDGNNVMESSKKSSEDVSSDEREVKSDEVAGLKSDEKEKEVKCGVVDGLKTDEKIKSGESVEEKSDENVGVEKGESGKKGDVSVMSSNQAKTEEEDLGWDEIEDIGSGDEKKISTTSDGGRPNRAELRKQLNAEEDDADLSWDIEDDDEPVKKS